MRKLFTLLFLSIVVNAANAQFAHQNIDLLGNFDDPAVQPESVYGIRYQSCWGYVDSLGNEYGIIGSTAGTYIIDVTDPSNPVQHTYIPHRQNDCIWHEYKSFENYLYIISDDGGSPTNSLQIVDMKYLPDSIHMVYDDTTIFVHSHTQYIDGDRWYVASVTRKGGNFYPMAVYSLANPESPTLLRALNQDFPNINGVHDMFVIHDTIFASCGYQGLFIFKYDEQNNQFVQLGALPGNPNNYNHSSFISNDRSTLYVCEEVPAGLPIQVVDISDIANPSVLSTFVTNAGCTPHNPYVLGNFLYLAAYSDGVYVYDISNPHTPVNTGFFDSHPQNGTSYPNAYEGAWAAYTDLPSGVLLVSDMQYGLFVLDKTISVNTPSGDWANSGFSVYPNPSQADIHVRIPNLKDQQVAVSIIAMDGKTVFSSERNPVANEKIIIPAATIAAGIYTLKATTASGNYVKRISIVK